MRKCVPKSQPPYCVSGGFDLQNLQVCKTYRSLLLQAPGPVRCRAGKSLDGLLVTRFAFLEMLERGQEQRGLQTVYADTVN